MDGLSVRPISRQGDSDVIDVKWTPGDAEGKTERGTSEQDANTSGDRIDLWIVLLNPKPPLTPKQKLTLGRFVNLEIPCSVVLIVRILLQPETPTSTTWRFRGSYKWGYKSPSMGFKYSSPAYNPTYNYP